MQKFFQSRRRRALAVAAPLALVASVASAAWITDGMGRATEAGTASSASPTASPWWPGRIVSGCSSDRRPGEGRHGSLHASRATQPVGCVARETRWLRL
jgi:hypothetical protein